MYSVKDDGLLHPPGCPIRSPPGQSFFPAHRRLSQVYASFFAYWCQGIHQQPLLAWPNKILVQTVIYELTTAHCCAAFFYNKHSLRYHECLPLYTLLCTFCVWRKSLSVDFYQWIDELFYSNNPLKKFTSKFLRLWFYLILDLIFYDCPENDFLLFVYGAVTKIWTWDLDIISVAL